MPKNIILVTGMHRSNTSLLGMLMDKTTCPFGSSLVPGDNSNPYGHFEDLELVQLHEEILKRNFSTWRRCNRRKVKIKQSDIQKARKILNSRYESLGDLWGFKVPHATLFLNMWKEFPELKFVFVFRKPLDVVRSLLSRAGKQTYYKPYYWVQSVLTYCVYNQEVRDFYLENPDRCVLIHNSDLLEDPQETLAQISWKLALPEPRQLTEKLIDKSIINRNSGRFVESLSRILSKYPSAEKVYQELSDLAKTEKSKYLESGSITKAALAS
jgi:hypothetical protein